MSTVQTEQTEPTAAGCMFDVVLWLTRIYRTVWRVEWIYNNWSLKESHWPISNQRCLSTLPLTPWQVCITITTLFLLQILILSFHHKTALQEDTAMRSFYLIMWNVPPVEGSAESKKVSSFRVETDFQANLVWTDSQSEFITDFLGNISMCACR